MWQLIADHKAFAFRRELFTYICIKEVDLMKKMILFPLTLLFGAAHAQDFPSVQTEQQVVSELNFLTSTVDQVGLTYQGTVGDLNGLRLPLSYYSTADYWAKYVGSLPGNDLHVVDVYNPMDYTLTPQPGSPGGDLQIERVNVFNGTDIYDAACWQIALAVCGKAGLKSSSGQDLFAIAQNQNTLLKAGYDGNAPEPHPGANRAVTRDDGVFSYNGEKIASSNEAYLFRMITRNWLSKDPFIGTPYMQYIQAENLPQNSDYQAGKITWMDWKPITGENAWAFLIGPLQTAYLQQVSSGSQFVPFSSDPVQNALGILYALGRMQSEIGAIYYACQGSLGNQGDQPVNPYQVSVENNASSLAGLLIFQQVLADELKYETDLSADQKQQVQTALSQIAAMIHGGPTPQGTQTKGLLSFFKNNAWNPDEGIFYQGGEANNPQLGADWVPVSEPKAVDVNTWTVSVLGQPLIDQWFGSCSAYKIWQKVKSWGGFVGPDGSIWGVGYSDQDGNGKEDSASKGIISAEWTAGAINMLRCLIQQYQAMPLTAKCSSCQRMQNSKCVQDLQKDHDSMLKNLMTLRTDLYSTTEAYSSVRPGDYLSLVPIPSDKLAFLYASKRYMLPFGWYANPLPSTTSTSWAILLHYNFNPFKIGGDYSPPSFELK